MNLHDNPNLTAPPRSEFTLVKLCDFGSVRSAGDIVIKKVVKELSEMFNQYMSHFPE